MRVYVRMKGDGVPLGIREHAERRIAFALGRFAQSVTSVTVRLDDINGDRKGVDQLCRIEVVGPDIRNIIVEELDSDVFAAIDRASAIAARAVTRARERGREFRGWPPKLVPTG